MIRVGELNRLITIKQPTFTQDGTGQEVPAWSNLASVYAKVKYDRGREGLSEDVEVNRLSRTFIIYFRDDVTEKMQIEYDGDTFDIIAINQIGYREGLEIQTDLHQ